MKKRGRSHAAPPKAGSLPTAAMPPESLLSVLLPERFGRVRRLAPSVPVSGLLQSHIHPRSSRLRVSLLRQAASVFDRQSMPLTGDCHRFSGDFLCRYPIVASTIPRPKGDVNRVFSQNVRKPGTNILPHGTCGRIFTMFLGCRRRRRQAKPPESFSRWAEKRERGALPPAALRVPARRPRRRWRGCPAGSDPCPGPCEAAG